MFSVSDGVDSSVSDGVDSSVSDGVADGDVVMDEPGFITNCGFAFGSGIGMSCALFEVTFFILGDSDS